MGKAVSITSISYIEYGESCIYQGTEAIIFNIIIQPYLRESFIPSICIYPSNAIIISMTDLIVVFSW